MTERHNHKKQSLSAKKETLSMQSVHEEPVTPQKHMHSESKKILEKQELENQETKHADLLLSGDQTDVQIKYRFSTYVRVRSVKAVCHHFPNRSQTTNELAEIAND